MSILSTPYEGGGRAQREAISLTPWL